MTHSAALPTGSVSLSDRRMVHAMSIPLGYQIRTLLILSIVVTAAFYVCLMPTADWVGAQRVSLPILVIDRVTGRPIPRATVSLVHKVDDERAPVTG